MEPFEDYYCYLTYINLCDNKNIKNFCEIKICKATHGLSYFLCIRKGRISGLGKSDMDCYVNSIPCIKDFKDLFYEYTMIEWGHRYDHIYVMNNNNYQYNYLKQEPELDSEMKLSEEICELLNLIYTSGHIATNNIYEQFITKADIIKSKDILLQLREVISTELRNTLSISWYTLMPTYMTSILSNIMPDEVAEKMEFIEDLENLLHLYKYTSQSMRYKYEKLKADIFIPSDHEIEGITAYFNNTYTGPLKIAQIYSISRYDDNVIPNTAKLLFHGSSNINYQSILSKGLLIKPEGVTYSGSIFGNGIYFSNTVNKCILYTKHNVPAIIILCAVDMGPDPLELITPLKISENSVHGIGRYTQSNDIEPISINGISVNISPLNRINKEATLTYDEYVIFDPARVSIRYILILS